MRRLAGAAVSWVVGLGALCGCSASDPARPSSGPASTSVVTSDEPTWPPESVLAVPEPSPPPIDDGTGEAQAEKFVRYVVDEINYTWSTTYVESVLRNQSCRICLPVVEVADEARTAHRLFSTDGWTLLAISSLPVRQPRARYLHSYLFDVTIDVAALALVRPDGSVESTDPARRLGTRVLVLGADDLKWSLEAWAEFDQDDAAPA